MEKVEHQHQQLNNLTDNIGESVKKFDLILERVEHNDQQLHNLTDSINDMLAIAELKASERTQRLDESTSNIRTVMVEL